MSKIAKITRRAFIGVTGASAITVGGLILSGKSAKVQDKLHGILNKPANKVNLFIQVGTDNIVSIVSHRVEMGQGIKSGLPLVVAEEMGADWEKVSVVQAPGHPDYGNQDTDGSQSVRKFYLLMRQLGASARKMLEQAAAQQWRVSISECHAINHQVVHEPSGRSLSFGELAKAANDFPVPLTSELEFRSESEFEYIGKDIAPVDLQDMVTGNAHYTMDIQRPGMVYAVVEHAPVIGAKLLSCDESDARKVSGVIEVFTLPELHFPVNFKPLHGVVVVAKDTWSAIEGRRKLKCSWSDSVYSKRSSATLKETLTERLLTEGKIMRSNGDVSSVYAKATETHEAFYSVPYLAHASMEPPVAVAEINGESCEVWSSSQNPQDVRNSIADLLGMSRFKVKVNVPLLGGGFGRKSKSDFSAQVALIAQNVGKPIKLVWTREDDIKFDYFHAMSLQYYRVSLDSENNISSWLQRAAYPSIGSTYTVGDNRPGVGELGMGFLNSLYDIEHFQAESHEADEAVRIGWLRSVCNIQHAFANNSFADELAYKRGIPPVQHLKELYGEDRVIDASTLGFKYSQGKDHPINIARIKNVIDLVVAKSGFSELPKGQGWGIAAHFSFFSYVAVATRVLVVDEKINVEEVHIAIDCGQTVNTDRVKAQMEGSVVFGLSLAMVGKIDVENGQVQQSNFHDYPLLRFHQTPTIYVHIVENHLPPAGVGEPGVPPVAPSLTNAIFAASSKRIRELPVNQTFSV